jgi:lysophospholipase
MEGCTAREPFMELISTDDNPLPPGVHAGITATPDGASLRHAYWRTVKPPCKGTVLLLQGRGEFIEKYFETVAGLREEGFDVCTFDWRGQGGSSRLVRDIKKGYIDNFNQYVTDLEAIIGDIALPDCRPPYFILGHSLGGLVALAAAPQLSNRIQRMVLVSPLLRYGNLPVSQGKLTLISGFLCAIGLGAIYLGPGPRLHENRRFANNPLTSDMRRFERNSALAIGHPELAVGGPTAAWLFAAGRAMEQVWEPDFIGSISIPTLLVAAGADTIVSVRAIEEMGFKMRSGKTLVIPGARHEMLQERDHYREQLLAAFLAFVPGTSLI